MKNYVCPYCEGPISGTAQKCQHCGEWLAEQSSKTEKAAAAFLSLIIPGSGQLLQKRFFEGVLLLGLTIALYAIILMIGGTPILALAVHVLSSLEVLIYS